MTIEIKVPALGESVTEATVGKWLKQAGEAVKVDEPLVELETDKVSVEVPSPVAGVLADILADAGTTVAVGAVLGRIKEGAAATAAPTARPAPAAPAAPAPTAAASTAMPPSPAARKIIEEKALAADAIAGSGRRGQVLKEDAAAAAARPSAAAQAAAHAPAVYVPAPPAPSAMPQMRAPSLPNDAAREERVRMTRLRQTIARRLKEAQSTAAMLTTFNDVDMSAVMALRNQYKDLFEKRHGVKLGFMGFFVKACLTALKEIPAVNAEIDGTDIIYKNYYHVGVAVGTDKGLVVPVVREADRMSLAEIEITIADFGKRARDGRLGIEEMQGGTFTISNGGVYGSMLSTPILNVPQSGILGMHRIEDRPVVRNGQIVIRPMMYLALSYDHRIVDGKEAVTFLVRVKECLEDPQRFVLEL
ncbi:MAG: 2-oxoglutarate dehydrogenase complex dihydrolipoyllysine-residue succinyltransferase [Hyphomicrobiaceae bacterium]|nr:2-oxoglutarate dehydrogenase complex dihydrolipoyllysine-residue succinyltransferase [Hyphomicrobiaceae bacterium]